MLRKQIFIIIFLTLSFDALSYLDYKDFFSLEREMRGVKKITEKGRFKSKTVFYFDKEGFLLREINYHKNKIWADFRYEYSISDTLLEIKSKEYRNINNEPESYSIHKYYYNSLKQCHRVEFFSSKNLESPFVWKKNFIYKDNKLQSFDHYINIDIFANCWDKYIYVYEDNQKTELYYTYEDSVLVDNAPFKITSIYNNGKLTDCISEQSAGRIHIVSGIGSFNSPGNKEHIRYSNFDKRGNWTKSYFITEKGKVFRSKRKIEYW
jgi:hypothetical protein